MTKTINFLHTPLNLWAGHEYTFIVSGIASGRYTVAYPNVEAFEAWLALLTASGWLAKVLVVVHSTDMMNQPAHVRWSVRDGSRVASCHLGLKQYSVYEHGIIALRNITTEEVGIGNQSTHSTTT